VTGATGPLGRQGLAGSTATFNAYSPAVTAAGGKLLQSLHAADALTITTGRLVHVNANLAVVVADRHALTQATNNASDIVTKLGGYEASGQYSAGSASYGRASLDLRVPLRNTQVALQRLGQLGKLVSQSVATQDLQQQATKQTNEIGGLSRAIQIYQQALLSGTLSGSDRVQVQIRLANAEHQLKYTRTAHSRTVTYGRTAEIRMYLSTNQHAFVFHHSATGRFGRFLHHAGDFLAVEGLVVLYALIILGPIVLLGALAWWLMRERRRKEEKLLTANA